MILNGKREDAVRPVFQIAMPRPPCIYAPGGTMHVVARCKILGVNFGVTILGVRSLLLLFLTMGTREIIFQGRFE